MVKNMLMMKTCSFLLHNILIELEWCGLLVDYCDVFISCLDSHSDGTHSLQLSANFNFSVNYSFKEKQTVRLWVLASLNFFPV